MPLSAADEVRGRLHAYVATGAAIGALGGLIAAADWRTDAGVHTLHETAATLLALLVGTLALVRHYSRRERLFLVIGIAFLGTATLDAFHTVVTFVAPREDSAGLDVFAPWSWLAARTFLAAFLFRLAVLPRPRLGARGAFLPEPVVYGATLAVVFGALLLLMLVPLPASTRLAGLPFARPLELLPAALLLASLAYHLRMRNWKRNVFEHWLILALMLGGASDLFMAFSAHLYDPPSDAAHLLKTASYACVLVGLLASVFFAYRRLEEHRSALARANVSLLGRTEKLEAAEHELRIRTAYLEQLIDCAPEGIVIVDRRDRVLRINAEFTRIFGFDEADVAGRTLRELIVQPEAAREVEAVTRAVAGGLTVSYDTVRRRRDGSLVEVSLLAAPIRTGAGFVAAYGIYRDLTDRRVAEHEKSDAAARLEAVIAAAPVGVITLDASGSVRTWNPTAETMLGIPARHALGKPLPLLSDDPDVMRALDRALEGDAATTIEIQRDGGPRILVSATPLAVARGPAGTLLLLSDATHPGTPADPVG